MNILNRIGFKIRHYHSALGPKGVLLFLGSKIARVKPMVKVAVRGIAHPVKLRIGTTDISTYLQVLVERQYEFDLPQSPRFIIDAGANIGLASIYFANRYPEAKIVAIEPEETNYRLLCENVAPYPQVQPRRAALWQDDVDLCLFDCGEGNHGFRVGMGGPSDGCRIGSVPGVTIDSIMRDAGVEKVNLLKIDIEGAECEIMQESAGWIGKVEVLMIELHDHIKPGCSESFYEATRAFSNESTRGETVMRHTVAAVPGMSFRTSRQSE